MRKTGMVLVTWEVDDGYCGRSRPQHTYVDPEDLKDLSDEERDAVIDDHIREDFEAKIAWSITRVDYPDND